MISIRVVDKSITVFCSKNQLIDMEKLRRIYHTVLRLREANSNFPLKVNSEKNVILSASAELFLNKLEKECADITFNVVNIEHQLS